MNSASDDATNGDGFAGRAHGASSLYPLSGLLFCAKDRRYYICASSRNGRDAREKKCLQFREEDEWRPGMA